jgi:hypothetical protein
MTVPNDPQITLQIDQRLRWAMGNVFYEPYKKSSDHFVLQDDLQVEHRDTFGMPVPPESALKPI